MSRVLAIDHGSRRIGLAVGETETSLAFARPALVRKRFTDDVAAVAQLMRDEGIASVIVGLPLNMDGSEGAQAAAARRFGAELAKEGLAVAFADERLTSWQARRELAAAGRRPGRASGEVDSAAARLLLQEYLDARRLPAGESKEAE
ncbi:MAG: Holliday junction resolvase RuvX [Candidatus Limnocylindria bacterium]